MDRLETSAHKSIGSELQFCHIGVRCQVDKYSLSSGYDDAVIHPAKTLYLVFRQG